MVLPIILDVGGIGDDLDEFIDPNVILNPVLDRADAAQIYASQVQTEAINAIQTIADSGVEAVSSDLFNEITDDLFNIDSAGISGINITEPTGVTLDSIVVADPATVIPPLPEMEGSDIDSVIGSVPSYDVVKPGIFIPELPEDDFPAFTASEPTVNEIETPSKPDYILPDLPLIEDVSIPSPPDYNVVSFEGEFPVADLTTPEAMFVFNEAEYDSDVQNKLAEKLYADLVSGGSGLDDDTEQAIYDRATSREDDQNEAAYTEALNFHSSRGFNLPEGVLNATLVEANDRINQRKTDINNDILAQQSNLAQVNTQFAITQAITMEQNLMTHSNQVQGRAFEVARATVQLANEIYRVKTEKFLAQLEGYRVQSQVYEIRIRAEISKAEFYKAQIDGIKAGIDAKALLISAYNAQVEGIKTLVQMYSIEMEAARIKADIDSAKLETYKTQAEVFGIKTNAITSQYNAYSARIAGEAEKSKMYLAESQAYVAKIDGFKAGADVEFRKSEVKLNEHQGNIAAFRESVNQYRTESERLVSQAEIALKVDGLEIDKYRADTAKYETGIDALIKDYLGKVEAASAEANVLIKEREVAVQKLLGEKQITTEMILGQTKIGSQLAAAAMTAVSSSTSLGLSESVSVGSSKSRGVSMSQSVSESFNHQLDD